MNQVIGTPLWLFSISIAHREVWEDHRVTDFSGCQRGNEEVAKLRAESVRSYLMSHFPEIDPNGLTARGIGRPKNENRIKKLRV
jgi:hypothetical protein